MDGLSRYGTAPCWTLPSEAAFSGITADSRAVREGMIFAALPGARSDGRDFIAEAVARGAAAVLAPTGTRWPPGVPPRPLIEDAEPRRRLAEIAATLAGPLPETILGVTGTNGKTSTVDFTRQMIAASGRKAASLGTLGLIAPGFAPGASLTTPDPVTLAGTLAALQAAGIGTVALEASSHGLDQFRLHGLRLAAGGFSNLTRDHLDYHGDMASYREAKLLLFKDLLPPGAPAVAMADLEPATLAALREIAQARRLDFATVGAGGDLFDLRGIAATPSGQVLSVAQGGVLREIELPLPGRFQADNALLAAALARAAGVSDPLGLLPGLKPVRGRLERAAVLANGAAAYVDYAHTPDALERLLVALRPHAAGRLVLVFGAGGDRDRGKRRLMGEVAARLADIAIITDDNPRSEAPASIRAEILAACPDAREIGDRRAAIAAGLGELRTGDVLAVAGKGHESGQIVGDVVLPFDDAAVIRDLAA
ncbi:UDP-N-acetylmuramoyl-L-alanyl-D-glutamate--2,6-diaminopimelate ligase [Acidiphilium sp. C61]|jgi:UDP-N-acetylmuramoyl-L-alanyl-D-glutamate--2,6-diaminopimelate ligase|uniref:UDP-N-acetylmuramoyl-L-alanyl-D-glutamate--2, 6-diaminopimelate ligase n=1 Tax=Acidiphilium sp. C61 TaxID=1671485 RepID=UPI00157AC822|nr:UDP-N-acetylmuramoyl-L-alanyl-D-glutamate--2,6-diaminopimelate ligase [Acidiphilium sp. C61]